MTVAGIAMAKDEADVIEAVLRHMADEGMDLILVADNGSTDGTREILASFRPKGHHRHLQLVVIDDPDPAYYQSQKMTGLAQQAALLGATWIVPFDADEIWFHPDERVGVWLDALPAEVGVVRAGLTNHFRSALDGVEGPPFQRMQWRQPRPAALPKVAFRWQDGAVIAQGNHGVHGVAGTTVDGLQVRHFPYRSLDQFIRKAVNGAAAYAATDLPDTEGAHWRQYGALLDRYGDKALEEVWETYYHFLAPVDAGLVHDPAPYLRWR